MNDPDILIIGAGPAGSAAARVLAQAGLRVLLVDQHPIGRDKVCGDGLIPDAHQALARVGVLEQVMAAAQPAQVVRCVAPRGHSVDVPGTLAVLPRKQLDELLVRAALQAGAEFLQARFEAPLHDERGRVVGARLRCGEAVHELRAPWTLLASGAVPKALQAAGLCTRHTPSGVALRGYVHAPELVAQRHRLEVVWTQAVRPGYGWIFPAPGGHFNIGVGVIGSHATVEGKGVKGDINLRSMFDAFVAGYPPAARLMREGRLVGDLKGAPVRCTLQGATFTRPGLMAIGEAAGATYSFTGEGIGKAMQTAIAAAEALLAADPDARRSPTEAQDAAVRAAYEAALHALRPKYAMYERANQVDKTPWLVDLLIWRAGKSERLRRRMSGVLEETSSPGNLVGLKGLWRILST